MGYEVSRKQMIFLIRLLVIIVTAYVVLFTPSSGQNKYWAYGFIAFYLFTDLLVAYLPKRYFSDLRVYSHFAVFDTLMIMAGIYLSGMVGTDFYLIFFLIICLTSLSAQFRYLMISVILFVGVYGWYLYQRGYLTGDLAVSYSLRLPFIVVIALFYGFIVNSLLRDKERRLQETQARYRQLFQSSDVFVYAVDQFGVFLSANPKLYESYGFSEEKEILGLQFSEINEPEEAAAFQEKIDTVYKLAQPVQYESYNSRLDQWYSITLSPILTTQNKEVFAVGVVAKDITERVRKEVELKKAYDKLRETRDQLIQKDKMAALGRLASGVAHEIRNPLEIISMGVDYLENTIPDENEIAQQSVQKIYNAIDRANTIINDVLKFSRKAEFRIETVDICGLVDEALSFSDHHIRKAGVSVSREFDAPSITVAANKNMLSQVLINLINNAVDAMADVEARKLCISICTQTVTEVGYKTGYRRADYFKIGEQMVVVSISDTGKGIAEDVLPKIFEPFFTTKETGKGTGLGLSLSHMILDRMFGTIDVNSRIGIGTTFYVKLQPEANMEKVKEAGHDG